MKYAIIALLFLANNEIISMIAMLCMMVCLFIDIINGAERKRES